MSGQLGELVVSISADLARFREDMGKANRTAQDTMNRMHSDVAGGIGRIERSFSSLGSAVGGALSVGAVMAFSKECVNAALAAEKLNMQFKASTGNANVAGQELKYVKDLSASLGLEMVSTAEAYGKFLASTRDTSIEGEKTRKVFEGVSEASTALGLSADETKGIFLALSQMMSKGKVQAEELTGQLGERLPGALKLAANGMGMTTAELMKQMQEGKVMSSELLPKLAAELHKTYGGAAVDAAAQGRAGMTLFKNEVFETAAAIGSTLIPKLNELARFSAQSLKETREGGGGFFGFIHESAKITIDYFAKDVDRLKILYGEYEQLLAEVAKRSPLGMSGGGVRFWEGVGAQGAAREDAARRDLQGRAGAGVIPADNYDPQMSRLAADRRARQEEENARRAAKERTEAGRAERDKAAEKARQDYNRGIQAYNRLVDQYNALRPDLSESDKLIQKLHDDVEALAKSNPEQAEDARRVEVKTAALIKEAAARKVANEEMKQSIRLMEEATKDWSLEGLGQGVAPDALLNWKPQKNMYSLTGPGYSGFSQEAPTAKQMGSETERMKREWSQYAEIMAQGDPYKEQLNRLEQYRQAQIDTVQKWDDTEIEMATAKSAALLKIDADFIASKKRIDDSYNEAAANSLMSSLGQVSMIMREGSKQQFEQGKALAEVLIAIDTARAASSAFAGAAAAGGPWGVAMGVAAGAAAIVAGMANMARLDSIQYEARALGGPVNAGQTYLVGEKGPELFTAGASGQITSNDRLRGIGGSIGVTNVYQISTGVAETVRAEVGRMAPYIAQMSVAAVRQAIDNGGDMAVAVGRR